MLFSSWKPTFETLLGPTAGPAYFCAGSFGGWYIVMTDLLGLNPAKDTNRLIEALREITELLIFSDRQLAQFGPDADPSTPPPTPDFFEYFLELNLHVYMCWLLGLGETSSGHWNGNVLTTTALASSNPFHEPSQADTRLALAVGSTEVWDLLRLKIQVLQSLNILFESLQSPQVFYYLLSNNFVNWLVIRPRLDVQAHDELVPYYIALLKALSTKLAAHTALAPFFFNAQAQDLPIYSEAIKYHRHPDTMVRVAIRTLTLNIFTANHPGFSQVVVNEGNQYYLLDVLKNISRIPLRMEAALGLDPSSVGFASGGLRHTQDISEFRRCQAEFLEDLDYLGDILRFSDATLLGFMRAHMLRLVIEPLIFNLHRVRPTLYLLLINHLFQGLEDAPLINLGLQHLFGLDGAQLAGPPLPHILPPPPASVRLTRHENEPGHFFTLHANPAGPYDRKDLFHGHTTPWGLFNTLLRGIPSRRKLSPPGDSVPLSQLEPQLILLLLLVQTLSRKHEIRPEWLIALGVCPVKQLRAWFIMDSLTSSPRASGDASALDEGRALVRSWLRDVDNPNAASMGYFPKAPQVLLKLLARHPRLHYVTARLAANLLFDLTYFPGTEPCLCPALAQRLQSMVGEMSGRLTQCLVPSDCPVSLVLYEFERFQDKIDDLPSRILGIDVPVLFSTPLDPASELASPLAQTSRTTQMFLILHRLAHWLLRSRPAIPVWWKAIEAQFSPPVLCGQTVALEPYLAINVEVAASSPPVTLAHPGSWLLLFREGQSQFLLACARRKAFATSRKATVVKALSLLDCKLESVPGDPHQLQVQHLGWRAPDWGLAKFPAAHSFPSHHVAWSATLLFRDYFEGCQAEQNLLAAQRQCRTSGRHRLVQILELPLPNPLGTALVSPASCDDVSSL
ncbi:Protein CL16A [Massospora cicadina]|nr:Protein CL16A [Massospora cicadina]